MSFIDPDEQPTQSAGFVDPDEDDGKTHIEMINGVPTPVKGDYKPVIKKPVSLKDRAIGVGEAALQAGSSGIAMIPGLLRYGDTDALKEYMGKVTYQPKTEQGQEMGEQLGEVFNQVGVPMMGVRLPHVSNRVLRNAMPEAFKEIPEARAFVDPDTPVRPPIDPVAQHELFAPDEQGKVANPYGAAEGVWRNDENGIPIRADLSMDAQNAGNPLQRNLFGDQLEPTRNPVGQAADLFAENGMQEQLPLTEALDNMGWAERRGAIKRELRGNVESSGELEAAMIEATPERVTRAADQLKAGVDIEKALEELPTVELRREAVEEANPLKALNFPKGQRGGFDFNAINDAIKQIKDKMSPPAMNIPKTLKPIVKTGNEHMAQGVPGLGKALENWIPDDAPVAQVLAEVAKEAGEDGSILLKNFRSGIQLTALQRKSAAMTHGGRWILNADKRTEKSIRTHVEPAEQATGRLMSKEVVQLSDLLKGEDMANTRLDAGKVAGLSPKLRAAYTQIRSMKDEAWAQQNAARIKQGLDPLTKREAYMASVWGGRFTIPVYNKAGKLIWQIAETNKKDANAALAHLIKSGVDVDKTRSVLKLNKKGLQTGTEKGSFEQDFHQMRMLVENTDPDSIKAYEAYGQSKHFEDKIGVRGFKGDRPWKDPVKDAYDNLRAQMENAKGAFKWSESQEAVTKMKQLLTSKEMGEQPHNAEYLRQYTKQHLGYGENAVIAAMENGVANWFAEHMNYRYGSAAEMNGFAKTVFILHKLALNAGFIASQMIQPLNMIPHHAELSSKGYKHNVLKTVGRAALDWASGAGMEKLDLITKGNSPKMAMTHLGKDAWAYMQDNGIVKRTVMDEARGLGEHPVWDAAVDKAGTFIRMSEDFVRGNTFLSYAHHLDQSGKFKTRKELFQKAEEMTEASMVSWRKEERPMIFEKGGVVGSSLSLLKSYLFNYWNNMGRWGQMASEGNVKPLLYAVALQQALYGTMNIPGMQEADWLMEKMKTMLPDNLFKEVKDMSLKQFMLERQGDWSYGGISKAFGVNFANRGNVSLTDAAGLDAALPYYQEAWKQAKGVWGAATNPNQTTLNQLGYNLAPAGPLAGMAGQTDAFKTGEPDAEGNQKYQKPSKLGQHDYDFERNPDQVFKKDLGFTELQEAKQKDAETMVGMDERILRDRRDKIVEKAWDSIVRTGQAENPEMEQLVSNYIAFHGDPQTLVDDLLKSAYDQHLSRTQILEIKNNLNLTDIQKIQAIARLVGK